MLRFLTLPIVLLLIGCVATGVQVKEQQLTAFQKGKTTVAEVVSQLGQPTTETLLSDGRRMIMYNYVSAQARPENFVPLVGPLIGGADVKTNMVILTFDQNGVLQEYSASASQYGSGRGLSAGTGPSDRVNDQPRKTGGQ